MTSSIKDRLKQAIEEEEERTRDALTASHERALVAEESFQPVTLAAEEIQQALTAVSSIKINVGPDSVWITLADRILTFGYDQTSRKFLGEEVGHSWYDGESYTYRYDWDSAAECIEAMIRLCAKYVRMAQAISSVQPQT